MVGDVLPFIPGAPFFSTLDMRDLARNGGSVNDSRTLEICYVGHVMHHRACSVVVVK
jgi:hypothetical protein